MWRGVLALAVSLVTAALIVTGPDGPHVRGLGAFGWMLFGLSAVALDVVLAIHKHQQKEKK